MKNVRMIIKLNDIFYREEFFVCRTPGVRNTNDNFRKRGLKGFASVTEIFD